MFEVGKDYYQVCIGKSDIQIKTVKCLTITWVENKEYLRIKFLDSDGKSDFWKDCTEDMLAGKSGIFLTKAAALESVIDRLQQRIQSDIAEILEYKKQARELREQEIRHE